MKEFLANKCPVTAKIDRIDMSGLITGASICSRLGSVHKAAD